MYYFQVFYFVMTHVPRKSVIQSTSIPRCLEEGVNCYYICKKSICETVAQFFSSWVCGELKEQDLSSHNEWADLALCFVAKKMYQIV